MSKSPEMEKVEMIRGAVFALVLTIPYVLASSGASAHGGATGVVKERMELMSELGKHMKNVAEMMKGNQPFDPVKAVEAGKFISAASPKLPPLFPEGSLVVPSEATPSVWENWSRFEALFDEMQAKSAAWAQISQQGDRVSIIRHFADVGKVCTSCHTDFRKKRENH